MIATQVTFTVINGATLSNVVRLSPGECLLRIQMPAAIDSTSYTLEGSTDLTNYGELCVQAGTVQVLGTPAAGKSYGLDPIVTRGLQAVRLKLGAAASADRNFAGMIGPV